MTALDRLLGTLAKLSQSEQVQAGGWRALDGVPLAAGGPFAKELSETIVPAHLIFRNTTEETLGLQVGNRRLVGLRPPIPASLATYTDLFDRDLSAEDAARVAAALRAFASPECRLLVRPDLTAPPMTGSARGLAAETLAKAWSSLSGSETPETVVSDTPDGDATEAVADFIADITPNCAAWALFVGDSLKAHDAQGPDKDVLRIKSLLPDVSAVHTDPAKPSLMAVGACDSKPTPCVAIWFEDWVFCARAITATPDDLGQSWRRLHL